MESSKVALGNLKRTVIIKINQQYIKFEKLWFQENKFSKIAKQYIERAVGNWWQIPKELTWTENYFYLGVKSSVFFFFKNQNAAAVYEHKYMYVMQLCKSWKKEKNKQTNRKKIEKSIMWNIEMCSEYYPLLQMIFSWIYRLNNILLEKHQVSEFTLSLSCTCRLIFIYMFTSFMTTHG